MSFTKRQERHIRTLAALPTDNLGPDHYATLDALVAWAQDEVGKLDRQQAWKRGAAAARSARADAANPDRWSQDAGYAAVDRRSRGMCEHPDGCRQRATHHHHIAGRGGPDPHHPDNLMHLCQPCHDLVHANPEHSYRLGTMAKRTGASR